MTLAGAIDAVSLEETASNVSAAQVTVTTIDHVNTIRNHMLANRLLPVGRDGHWHQLMIRPARQIRHRNRNTLEDAGG